jgi:hypothetical protein
MTFSYFTIFEKLHGEGIRRIKGLWRRIFFQYPDALHELNRVSACPALSGMATKCAEIALAWVNLRNGYPA